MNAEFADSTPPEQKGKDDPCSPLTGLKARSTLQLVILAWLLVPAFYLVTMGILRFPWESPWEKMAALACLVTRLAIDYFALYLCYVIVRRDKFWIWAVAFPALFFGYLSVYDLQLYPKLLKIAVNAW